jgi:hypothetical protein
MIDLTLPLTGPAANIAPMLRSLATKNAIAVLLDGDPGIGKSHLLDSFALDLAKSKFAIEQINGQTVNVAIVREWRERACYGNLFSQWTVKRIDEIDQMGGAAVSELLTYLDYLQPHTAILASTNDYGRLRAESKGRLETRFVRVHIDAPSINEAADYLTKHFKLPKAVARAIADGAVPDGFLSAEGVNMRACVKDARGYLAARAKNGRANRPNGQAKKQCEQT